MRKPNAQYDLVTWLAPVALAGLLAACGGGADRGAAGGADTAAAAPATPPAEAPAEAPAETPEPAPAAPAGGGGGGGGGAGDPKLIALGDSIFHGQAGGGTCYACHGQDGKGSAVGPNLTDKEWLNTDGSYDGIVKTVKSGVPQPKKAPAPMPPMGGATLTDDQVKAVAAYVLSLSQGG